MGGRLVLALEGGNSRTLAFPNPGTSNPKEARSTRARPRIRHLPSNIRPRRTVQRAKANNVLQIVIANAQTPHHAATLSTSTLALTGTDFNMGVPSKPPLTEGF